MGREEVIREIRESFLQWLSKFCTPDLARPYVSDYIEVAAAGLSDEELLRSFSDPLDVFDGYITYLEVKVRGVH